MPAVRRRVIAIYLAQGSIGLLLMLAMTWLHHAEAGGIVGALGANATILIAILVIFGAALQLLKFELTNVIYVSLGIVAFMVMVPLLGTVLSSWITVIVAIAGRRVGRPREDTRAEYAKTFGLFSTYGIPVVVAGTLYSALGGEVPVMHATPASALRIALASVALILTNNFVMLGPQWAYGYSQRQIRKLDVIDSSIYLVTIPFVVVMSLAYAMIG